MQINKGDISPDVSTTGVFFFHYHRDGKTRAIAKNTIIDTSLKVPNINNRGCKNPEVL